MKIIVIAARPVGAMFAVEAKYDLKWMLIMILLSNSRNMLQSTQRHALLLLQPLKKHVRQPTQS